MFMAGDSTPQIFSEKRAWRLGLPEKTPNPLWTTENLKGGSLPKNKSSVIIYSPSRFAFLPLNTKCWKPVAIDVHCIYFFTHLRF